MSLIRSLDELRRSDVDVAGGKGANLGELIAAGFPVPPGFVITTAAYRTFVEHNDIAEPLLDAARDLEPEQAATSIGGLFAAGSWPPGLQHAITDAYARLGSSVAVAVRSSATAEDLPEASFAGQQDTYLAVRGPEALLTAVLRCWVSLWGARALDYRKRAGVDSGSVALAVVVQEMVEAEASGVIFTANPETGRRDEVMIAAAFGLGESVVGGTVDADQLVIGLDGSVRDRRTGDKTVQTVAAGRGTQEVPVPEAERRKPVLDDAAAAELAALGRRAARHFGAPQDLEWVRAGGHFAVVQSRPITALPEPTGPVPERWPVPDPDSLYFRASIVELLPDPLSPLFAELAATAVPRSIRQMMAELAGRELIGPDEIGFPTINGYAYYRYGRSTMLKLLAMLPGLLRLVFASGSASLVLRWSDVAHPRYAAVVARWRERELRDLTTAELLDGLGELVGAGARYYTSVQTIIPLAATSEIGFTRFYDVFVRRPGDPPAVTLLLGFDSAPIRADKSLYDLTAWTQTVPGLATALGFWTPDELAAALADGRAPDRVAVGDWQAWRTRFEEHLVRYGHSVYNLDPVNPVPADDPAPLLRTVRHLLTGRGRDPYARQAEAVHRRERLTSDVLASLGPVRRRLFLAMLRWAQSTGPVREDALADVGLAWPRVRAIARELAARLVAGGAIESADDVYWLTPSEIATAASQTQASDAASFSATVAERRERWRGERRATPPQMLPPLPWLRWLESMMPAASIEQTGNVIRGLAGSSGEVTGVARVLSGPSDFARLQPTEILVASITTPAWTPLFAVAGGVVTDVGGPLSHSSIVAREYGIPAVLGTGVATRRIPDGALIRVDGDRGRVHVLDTDQEVDRGTVAQP